MGDRLRIGGSEFVVEQEDARAGALGSTRAELDEPQAADAGQRTLIMPVVGAGAASS